MTKIMRQVAWRSYCTAMAAEAVSAERNAKQLLQKKRGSVASSLHAAAVRGHLDVCRTLLDHGADVNIKKRSGKTPLMSALQTTRTDVVSLLLTRGAVKGFGTGQLHTRHSKVLSGMFQYGSEGYIECNEATRKAMQALSEEDKLAVMMRAASHNFPDELEMLLSLGVCPNVTGVRYGTVLSPLHVAASSGNVAACKILLDYGADVNIKTPSGGTPLMSASRAGRADVAELLVKRGARKTAPRIRPRNRTRLDRMTLLVANGLSDANMTWCRDSRSPLHVAAATGNISACKTLLDNGAEINNTTRGGKTPLLSAAAAGRSDIVALLLENGAVKCFGKVSTECARRCKMLRYGNAGYIRCNEATRKAMEGLSEEDKLAVMFRTITRNFLDELEMLLSLGVSPNKTGKHNGKTMVSPLHVAASAGNMAACRVLLAHGADVNIRTKAGATPLKSAQRASQVDIVALLRVSRMQHAET